MFFACFTMAAFRFSNYTTESIFAILDLISNQTLSLKLIQLFNFQIGNPEISFDFGLFLQIFFDCVIRFMLTCITSNCICFLCLLTCDVSNYELLLINGDNCCVEHELCRFGFLFLLLFFDGLCLEYLISSIIELCSGSKRRYHLRGVCIFRSPTRYIDLNIWMQFTYSDDLWSVVMLIGTFGFVILPLPFLISVSTILS